MRALPAALLAALLATTAPATWAANSGGDVVTIHSEDWYIGTPGSSNNNVVLDVNPDPSYPLRPYRAAAGGYSSTDDTVEGINGGFTGNGNATDNKVFINNGSTMDWIHGGATDVGNATGNKVFINGGEVKNVYGSSTYGNAATGNTVTLAGGKVTGEVWGGDCSGNPSCDQTTDNTLAVHAQGSTVDSNVNNFAILEFKLPASIKAGGAPMLKVGSDATFHTPTKVSISVDGSPALKKGDKITLIAAGTSGSGALTISGYPASISDGGYDFALSDDGKNLIAEVTKAQQPQQPQQPRVISDTPTMGEAGLVFAGLALA